MPVGKLELSPPAVLFMPAGRTAYARLPRKLHEVAGVALSLALADVAPSCYNLHSSASASDKM